VPDSFGAAPQPPVTFISGDSSVTVTFAESAAVLDGLGYRDVELPQAVSASGARYEKDGLELWNKGDEITISRNGETIFTGVDQSKAPASGIVGTWKWRGTEKGSEMLTPKKADAFTLTFGADGSVSGTTDCNSFSGSYTLTGNAIQFGALGMTKKFCEGSQENEFVQFGTEPLLAVFEHTTTLLLVLPLNAGTITLDKQQ
jgi:heat shock protein HslJ